MHKKEPEQIVDIEEQAIEQLLLRLKRHLEEAARAKNEESRDEVRSARERVRDKLTKMKKGDVSIDLNMDTEKGRVISSLKTTIDILEKKLKKMELQYKVKDDRVKTLEKMLAENGVH